MMGPPPGALLAVVLWLAAVAAAVAAWSPARRLAGRGPRRRSGAGGRLLFLTAVLPVLAAPTFAFDDYAVRRWFPGGTPPWFVGCEIPFLVDVGFALAAIVMFRRRPLAGRDWAWVGAAACVVAAAAALLWLGVSYGW